MRVPKGCPLCVGDVLGTSQTGYYCRHCNMIFQKKHIIFKYSREEAKGIIDDHFTDFSLKKEHDHLSSAEHRLQLQSTLHDAAKSLSELHRRVDEMRQLLANAESGILPRETILAVEKRMENRAIAKKAKKVCKTAIRNPAQRAVVKKPRKRPSRAAQR